MGVVWPVWGTVHKTLCGLHHLVEKGEMVRLLTEVQKMEETLVSVGRRRFVEPGYGAGKGLGGSRLQIREVSTPSG